jgi:hypothetical protein
MTILYVFADKGIPGASKIGKSATPVSRYRQARAHTPRGIRVEAMFNLGTSSDAAEAERDAKRALKTCHRKGPAKEWFDIDPKAAIEIIRRLPCMNRAQELRDLPPRLNARDICYDDWRETRVQFGEYRWRMFLFEEGSPERRLKVSHGALYDTAYRYTFTYNPWPVHLIAGFENPAASEQISAANVTANARVAEAWAKLVEAKGRPLAEEVGWLNADVAPQDVASFLKTEGLAPFDLNRAKPLGAPPKDASVPATAYGTVQPLHQVRPSPDIYGRND